MTISRHSTDTVFVKDAKNNVNLKFYLDQFGQLTAECVAKDRTIEALVKQVQEKKFEKQTEVREVKYIPGYIYMIIGGLLMLVILLSIIIKIKRNGA